MMNRRNAYLMMIGAVFVAMASARSLAEDAPVSPQAGEQPSAGQMQEMMAKWLATTKSGPNHAKLDPFVGEWNLEMKTWMGGPGSQPSVTKGESTIKWILDKHYLQEESTIEGMRPDETGRMKPVTLHGMGLTGYDNYRNTYNTTWFSNESTQRLTFSGVCDPSGKTFRYYGEMDEPMLDVTGRTIKAVQRIVSDDKIVFELYDLHAGDDYKVIEVTYTRKK